MEAAKALQFLAFVTVARMVTALVFDIQTGLGNTKVTIWLNLRGGPPCCLPCAIGANTGGIRGAATAHAVVAFVVAIPLSRAGCCTGRVSTWVRSSGRIVRPVFAAVARGDHDGRGRPPDRLVLRQLVVAGGLGMPVYLAIAVPAEGRAAARRLVVVYVGPGRGAHV